MSIRSFPYATLPLFINILCCSSFAQTNVTLLDQLDSYSSYASCWGYTAPDGREYALLGAFNGTSIVDITDGPNSYEVDFVTGASSSWRELKTYRQYAYVVNESGGGMQIIDLSDLPNSATLAATYTGFTTAHTVYIDTANAMLYCEGSSGQPVRVISLANPLSPVQLTTFGVECHDMYVHNNRCYVAEGFQGTVGVYDVTNPASPMLLQRIGIPASGYVHNVWTTEDDTHFLTTEETSGRTVKMWNIENLSSAFITDTYLSQPSNLAHNVHIKGNRAYIAHYGDGLRILDISDPTNIIEVGSYDTNLGTTGFVGAWGTYPYYASNKVIISDISNGLFVLAYNDGSSNQPPVVSDIPDQTITLGGRFAAIRVDTYVTDPDDADSTISWSWSGNTNLTITFDAVRRRIRVRPANGWTGTNTVTFTATDPDGLTDSDVVVFKVNPAGLNQSTSSPESGETVVLPPQTAIIGSFPNPFNPSTTIRYQLGEDSHVVLKIYNSLGQEVAALVDDYQATGEKSVRWDGLNSSGASVASGIYLVRLTNGTSVLTQRILLMK